MLLKKFSKSLNGYYCWLWWFRKHLLVAICLTLSCCPSKTESALKIDKDTIELLNNGLKALVSIRQILSTIQAFNELSTMLKSNNNGAGLGLPSSLSSTITTTATAASNPTTVSNHQLPSSSSSSLSSSPLINNSRPRMSFVQKIFGKLPAFLLLQNNKALLMNSNKSPSVQRDPSIGLIKIGEKPPPGLFPETLPYSVSQFEQPHHQLNPITNSNDNEALRLATGQMLDYSSKIAPESTEMNRYFYLSSSQSPSPPQPSPSSLSPTILTTMTTDNLDDYLNNNNNNSNNEDDDDVMHQDNTNTNFNNNNNDNYNSINYNYLNPYHLFASVHHGVH